MSQCKYEKCSEDAWSECSEGLCIYHSPANGKNKATASQLWLEARKRSQDPNGCNFTGWHFPPDPEGRWFIQIKFPGPALFRKACFDCGVSFLLAVFRADADFREVFFDKDKRFPLKPGPDADCRDIPGTALYPWPHSKNDAEFSSAQFRNKADFSRSVFNCTTRFVKAIFSSDSNFRDVEFGVSCDFTDVTFHGLAIFGCAKFPPSVAIFRGTVFHRFAEFSRVHFRGDALFLDAIFHKKAWFHRPHLEDGISIAVRPPSVELPFVKARPFSARQEGETIYRVSKQAAQRRGDYRRAGRYQFSEQCAIEYGNRKKYGWKIWRSGFWKSRLEWLFARMIFGYGEKAHRPFVTGLVVIFIWALLYFATGGVAPGGLAGEAARLYEPGFGECLYFSLVTFTTLGYGDMAPKAHLPFRFLAGGEALLGAGLMALFIVALARKYTR